MKPIELSPHAIKRAHSRGTTHAEIRRAVELGRWKPAGEGRFRTEFEFPYGREWNGKTYALKSVQPVFVELRHRIVVSLCILTTTTERSAAVRISYDAEVDALYIEFSEATVTTKEVGDGVALDMDAEGHLAGIEILDATKRLGGKDVFRRITLEDIALAQPA